MQIWLESVRLARSRGIKPKDLREIERLVYEHHELLLKSFHDVHGQS